jgi:hypothetical protein
MGLQPPFGARSQEMDGVVTIALSGELDMATVPILSDHHVLMLPDFDRADRIVSYWGEPQDRGSC